MRFVSVLGIYVNITDVISAAVEEAAVNRGEKTLVESGSRPKARANPLFLRDEELRQAMELMFYAYRDFTGEVDDILADYGFGRAHHRVIYFVGRNPEITVSQLLAILKITKQSLSRVLGQLMDEGYIVLFSV